MRDIYCNGYRWFNNYDETKKRYEEDLAATTPYFSDIQYYGQEVLSFRNICELNTFIHCLTLLRDSINQDISKHPKIHKEFGTNHIDYKEDIPYEGIMIFENAGDYNI